MGDLEAQEAIITSAAFRTVFEQLAKEDDLIAVLRGHLFLEIRLGEMLLTKVTQKRLDRLTFARKVELAEQERLITSKGTRALKALNKLRNSFAHTPIKYDLTEGDMKKLRKDIAGAEKLAVQMDEIEQRPSHPSRQDTIRAFVRFCFALQYGFLSLRLAGLLEDAAKTQ